MLLRSHISRMFTRSAESKRLIDQLPISYNIIPGQEEEEAASTCFFNPTPEQRSKLCYGALTRRKKEKGKRKKARIPNSGYDGLLSGVGMGRMGGRKSARCHTGAQK